jgi:O-methyltransferase involved in polyketide biosynthesis
MNEVNNTLFIPLYGKSRVSRQGIILKDPSAERIWEKESFPIRGRSASKWLAYNMAMRARVFDDWTGEMIRQNPDALVLHVGCGLDGRCLRVGSDSCCAWVDCDLPDVIEIRRKYFDETEKYHMLALDASDPAQTELLPDADTLVLVMEGLSMYLTKDQLRAFLGALHDRYRKLHILMDVYTEFGARASRYKNPVNDVGVTRLYGIDDMESVTGGLGIRVVKEHSFTPPALVNELPPAERLFFKMLFTGRIYGKIYRLYELEA